MKWWQEAIGYQIYPRSFKDSNGDGIGDLNGIKEKLTYLKDLGIDFIWLSPVYDSPNVDNGYDISNYKDILPDFGTMKDFDELLTESHKLGIKIVMDLVINHTSSEHPWFKEAKKSIDNPYHDYYIWENPKNGKEPNDWISIFGGSAWEKNDATNEYYFHTFAKEQPDLNWDSANLKKDIFAMITWWLDKGIDGFRIDAISHIKKAPFYLPYDSKHPFKNFQNVPGIEVYLKELKEIFRKYDIFTVGEASGVSYAEAKQWVGEDGYFDMIFSFDHIDLWKKTKGTPFDILKFKKAIFNWQEALENQGWNALYLENHDVPRSISVFGQESGPLREVSGKALGMMYLLLKGTPFIYQGQEIGMTNFPFSNILELDAVNSINHYKEMIGLGISEKEAMEVIQSTTRDNARTPMQWDRSEYGGFSSNEPWLKVNPNKEQVNVQDALEDSHSLFYFYQKLIHLRKDSTFIQGTFKKIIPENEKIFAYERVDKDKIYTVVVNLTEEQVALPLKNLGQLVLSNYDILEEELQAFEGRVYERRIYEK